MPLTETALSTQIPYITRKFRALALAHRPGQHKSVYFLPIPFLLIYARCIKSYLEAGLSPFIVVVDFAVGVVVKVISASLPRLAMRRCN